jgi:hypothetical protein
MRPTLMTAFACASLLLATTENADAQVFVRPWMRPRVVIVPRPWAAPVSVAPPVYVQQPPQTYYPPQYYYPPAPPAPVYVQPPPVYVQPAPVYVQPPQVYVQPPQVYVQPQPEIQQMPPPPVMQQQPMVQAPPPPVFQPPPPPVFQAPPPPVMAAPVVLPQWKAKFGVGFRFAATVNTDQFTEFSQLGFGGELLYRAHRRLVLELGGEYQKRVDNGFARYDVPVTFGLRIHIGAPDWVVSPYFVMAAGLAYSNLDFLRSNDIAWFADGQLGGGLEVRIGKHLALTADLRGDGRRRLTKPEEATANTLSIDGKPFSPMQDSFGLQARLGAALYF